jgi:hypothetical protein
MLRGVWELQREKGKRYDEDLRNTLMENAMDIHLLDCKLRYRLLLLSIISCVACIV